MFKGLGSQLEKTATGKRWCTINSTKNNECNEMKLIKYV